VHEHTGSAHARDLHSFCRIELAAMFDGVHENLAKRGPGVLAIVVGQVNG
jgi:hypothetical protein